jgi:nucleotide-binding universal stress UspA family protein
MSQTSSKSFARRWEHVQAYAGRHRRLEFCPDGHCPKQLGAKESILTVTEPWWSGASGYFIPTQSVIQSYEKLADDSAAKITSFANDTARQQGLACSVLHIKNRHPEDGIIEGAKENGCDLIVVGSRGHRALERFLLGSVATAVVAQSSVPVLICR